VTGFLTSQASDVASALKTAGFSARQRRREQDWVLIDGRRA
jgi:ribosomal protein L11 methylase PrmA